MPRLALLCCCCAFAAAGEGLAASQVRWDAGEHRLGDLVAVIGANGNTTVLDLAVDEDARRELPAFNGTYWEAVLVFAEAFDCHLQVAVAPSPVADPASGAWARLHAAAVESESAPVGFGPTVLLPGRREAEVVACGPLLLSATAVRRHRARRLGGSQRWAAIDYRVLCEPRVDPTSIHSVRVSWRRAAFGEREGELGPPEDLLSQRGEGGARRPTDPRRRMVRTGAIPAQDPDERMVAVRGLRADDRRCRLVGKAAVRRVRAWEVTRVLAADAHATFTVDGEEYRIRIDTAEEGKHGDRLVIRHDGDADLVDSPEVAVHRSEGGAIRVWPSGRSSGGSRQVFHVRLHGAGLGVYRVRVRGLTDLGRSKVRLEWNVGLP